MLARGLVRPGAWVLSLLISGLATAQEAKPGGVSEAGLGDALSVLRDFRDLARSVADDSAAADVSPGTMGASLARFGRPTKVVGKATVDSKSIDARLAALHESEKVRPADLVNDEDFIRRASMDLTGKPPTPEEVMGFVRERDADKRGKAVGVLLNREDFGWNLARYWRDVIKFRATDDRIQIVNYAKLEEWLAGQFNANRPWDEIVAELIKAVGNNNENGAASFTSAHMGAPVEVAGEVSRIFMGVQIQCAQCHDHPTDAWKREQFHEFAAFFAGVNVRPNRRGEMPEPGATVVVPPRRVRYTMPDLNDPTKTKPISPRFFLASSDAPVPETLTAIERRELAASYVTGQDNPWFSKAFVNRVWYLLVGYGFYNPIDDLGPTRECVAPDVLEALSTGFSQSGFDVKWLYRTIMGTSAYQRQFRPVASLAGKTPFASNCPSRLRGDQIFDALAGALGLPIENGAAAQRARSQGAQDGQTATLSPRDRRAGARNQFGALFGIDPSVPNEDVLGTIPQALFMMNSPIVNNAIASPRGVVAQVVQAFPENRPATEALYMRILQRRPTEQEIAVFGRYLAQFPNRREAFEDLAWALVNSTEFVSRR